MFGNPLALQELVLIALLSGMLFVVPLAVILVVVHCMRRDSRKRGDV